MNAIPWQWREFPLEDGVIARAVERRESWRRRWDLLPFLRAYGIDCNALGQHEVNVKAFEKEHAS
jgi:hypothetical protein